MDWPMDDWIGEMSSISMSPSMYFRYMTTFDLLEELSGALSQVISIGSTKDMEGFIKRNGIKPDDFKNSWDHPLRMSIRVGQVEHFHVLRTLGFYYDDEQGLLDMAASEGKMEFVKILMEQCPTQPTEAAIERTSNGGHVDIMDYNHLLTPRATLDYSMSLISAARCYNEANRHALCKLFLSRGANVIARDPTYYGNTALHFAARQFDRNLVELLLDAGANVNVRNFRDETPFLVSANCESYWYKFFSRYYDEHGRGLLTAKLLVSRGADPEAKSTDGKTVLHFALCSPNLLHYLLVDLNLRVDGQVEDLFKQATDFPETFKASINVLMSVGYYPKNVDVLLKLTEENHELSPNPESLQNLCCFKIRQILGRRLPSVVDDLPLPAPMKDFVRLSHLPQPPPIVWLDLEDDYSDYSDDLEDEDVIDDDVEEEEDVVDDDEEDVIDDDDVIDDA